LNSGPAVYENDSECENSLKEAKSSLLAIGPDPRLLPPFGSLGAKLRDETTAVIARASDAAILAYLSVLAGALVDSLAVEP
jgi:hypothetical protein